MKTLKKWDLEAAAARVRRIPQPYRASLRGPTSVRKIFRKQEDAINFAKQFGQEMMVFSYESLSLGVEGQRMFLASGIQSFFHAYRQMEPSARCHYEVIMVDRPAKLYLDLEFCKLSNENKDGVKAVNNFMKALCACIKFFYGISISLNEIVTLDASTPKKFSQHIIVNNENLVFQNNLEQGQLIRILCKSLAQYSLLNTDFAYTDDCSDCSSQISKFTQSVLPKIEFTENDAKSCFALPKMTQSNHNNNNNLWTSVCDVGVYTRNRNFRLAGSCKLSGSGLLLPYSTINKDVEFSSIWRNWRSWAPTLVTYVDVKCSHLLIRPVENCCCSYSSFTTSSPSDQSLVDRNIRVFPRESDDHVFHSLPTNLHIFVKKIITEWFNRGLSYQKANTDLSTSSSQVKIVSLSEGKLSVKVNKLRFCERIGRSHKSNHVILIFDFVNGCYYQKCLDPECRLVDFRSPSMPIPGEFLNITSISTESDRGTNQYEAVGEDGVLTADITAEDLMLGSLLDYLQK
ncbi:unnamed protein product [Heterobilharzia americana]|nr:unnamed protein product [Heterobilharzia americana]CAH8545329.1 unnamed protein product [Heterobilharzia americana]